MRDIAEASRQRFRALASVEIDPRAHVVDGLELQTIELLLRATDLVDEIFWRQLIPKHERASLLQQAGHDRELRELLFFHYGPYDSLDDNEPFFPVKHRSPGVEFYPSGLTQQEFSKYIESHAECRSSFESPYTIIRQVDSQLVAIPYHEAFREEVAPLAQVLRQASVAANNSPFGQFFAAESRRSLNG